MALKMQKTITLTNLCEISGEYWRIYKLEAFISSGGEAASVIGLELWANQAARAIEGAEPLYTVVINATSLLESRDAAYAWIKANVPIFSGAEDV